MNTHSNQEAAALNLNKNQCFTKADFTNLFNNASKRHGRFFILYYLQDPSSQSASLGTVVSKKNAKTSVKRNLIKRLIREHFRLNQHELNQVKLMFLTKREISAASKEDLNQDLNQLFTNLKELQKTQEHAKLYPSDFRTLEF